MVPLPAPGPADDELILDMQESDFADPSTGLPPAAEAEDTEMAVDEEGRPRFAPGKDIVRSPIF